MFFNLIQLLLGLAFRTEPARGSVRISPVIIVLSIVIHVIISSSSSVSEQQSNEYRVPPPGGLCTSCLCSEARVETYFYLLLIISLFT